MNPHSSASILKRHSMLLFTAFALVNCHGTEGDNPFSGTVDPSPCKGEADYANFASHRANSLASVTPRAWSELYTTQGQALVEHSEMPIGLRCLEWDYSDGKLQLAISNFAGGCNVGWGGGFELRGPGDLTIRLENPSCDIAKCGSCFYDTDATFDVNLDELLNSDQDTLDVELALHDCNGEVSATLRWQVPLREQREGMHCDPLGSAWAEAYAKAATSDSFSETQLNLYAQCGTGAPDDVECTEDRACVENHCVPACETDEDCPLPGVLGCQKGACQLR